MDYSTYHFTKLEYVKYILAGLAIMAVFTILFFDSVIACMIFSPLIYVGLLLVKKDILSKRREKLREEFCDALESIAVAMTAGYSVENALIEAKNEMAELHGEDALIVSELNIINNKVNTGVRVEYAIKNLATKSGVEEIADYSDIFSISKRTDGNIIKMSRNTSRIIRENIDVNKECITLIAGKKNELLIMRLMPPAMIAYLRLSSPGFFDGMYGNASGIIIMLVLLGLYIGINVISERITNKVIKAM